MKAVLTSEAQLAADLAWSSKGDFNEVNIEVLLGLIRNLSKFGLSETTITLPGGLSYPDSDRYVETIKPLLEGKGFYCNCYEDEYGDIDLHIDWGHLVRTRPVS